jgi:hypothetical protein
MWQVRTQFSKPNSENPTGPLEWNAVFVDTEAEAETWWQTRTTVKTVGRRVCTMFNPQGDLVRVEFK